MLLGVGCLMRVICDIFKKNKKLPKTRVYLPNAGIATCHLPPLEVA